MRKKKKIIDGIDKEILRALRARRSGLSGRQIAMRVGLSDSSISPRLKNLKKKGFIKDKCEGFRNFTRTFNKKKKKIRSCSKRLWKLDLE